MLIVFYSDIRGNTGTTSNLCSIASYLALTKEEKIILWANHRNWNEIQDLVTPRTRYQLLKEELTEYHMNGTKEIFCQLHRGRTEDKIDLQHFSKEIYPGKLYHLINTIRSEVVFEKEISEVLQEFITLCKDSDDLILCDLQENKQRSTTQILEQADLVIFNVMQHNKSVQSAMRIGKQYRHVSYLFGKYQSSSKINLRNIKRKYGLSKEQLNYLPYEPAFANAIQEGKVLEYLIGQLEGEKREKTCSFAHAIGVSAEQIYDAVYAIRREKEEFKKVRAAISVDQVGISNDHKGGATTVSYKESIASV
ncbi:hypothetical protein [Anaerosporobacter faecicola]|uniref:hypothetical protein n=1 Tax=Anaerosporobacter faecicola TaxID=2718714 RepID=UPI00143A27E8|nr:hypothetical protein [Anaerosporobacter faecicola]